MEKQYTEWIVRLVDFVAESLELQADGMPPSYKAQAESLREQARLLRNSSESKTIRVWEEVLPRVGR